MGSHTLEPTGGTDGPDGAQTQAQQVCTQVSCIFILLVHFIDCKQFLVE